MNAVRLVLITNIYMCLMVHKGLRGGVSYIAKRYAKPNKKYLSDYDKDKEISHLMYLHASNS